MVFGGDGGFPMIALNFFSFGNCLQLQIQGSVPTTLFYQGVEEDPNCHPVTNTDITLHNEVSFKFP